MKKKIVLTLLVLSLLDVYSQGGIDTPNSKITLDVAGNSTPAIRDGIIASRITADQLKNYPSLQAVK
ncbi:hypothetical protein LIV57_22745 [Chryseobacterium sp. X308]|uniref:hypothetical protein n=1 Tax=Chryseobacterium sp. X308 TaxID=2884873 RepID=UPI001D145076|nr:hypothetical protein [Chryseobacterium sp. X308]MCC3218092.1 hypothetical protein [Chryseobacterium sp. X308]